MLRITIADDCPQTVTFNVEGRIVSAWIEELERECHRFLERGKRVFLDFSGVTFVDRRAVVMLTRLLAEDAEIINCSALIQDLLPEESGQ